MKSTRDEILYKFAEKLKLSSDSADDEEELEFIDPKDITVLEEPKFEPGTYPEKMPWIDKPSMPKPPVAPWAKKPLSKRDRPEEYDLSDISQGMIDLAEKNTKRFLTDTQTDFEGFKGFVLNPRLSPLVEKKMNEIVESAPEKYFEWQLYHPKRHRGELQKWLYRAAISYIKNDPVGVILNKVFEVPNLDRFYNEIWLQAWDQKGPEYIDKKFLSRRERLDDEFLKQMTRLSDRIATTDPEFYELYIESSPLKTDTGVRTREQRQNEISMLYTK